MISVLATFGIVVIFCAGGCGLGLFSCAKGLQHVGEGIVDEHGGRHAQMPFKQVSPGVVRYGDFEISAQTKDAHALLGTIKNVGKQGVLGVEIDIALFDKAGDKLGSTFATVSGLGAGESKIFSAPLLKGGVETWRIVWVGKPTD